MMRMNQITGADHHSTLDHVFQLANISRPVMALERVDRVSSKAQIFSPLALCVALNEIPGEQRDIAVSIPKWGEFDSRDVESIKQICAEVVVFDSTFQGRIGSRDNARVQRLLVRAAKASKAPILYHTQEFCLELEWELGHFVEKNGPVIGYFEKSALERSRVRESSRLVTKELALQQGFRYRSTVDGDERLRRAWARSVDTAGEQFFAGASFSNEQDRHTAARGNLCRESNHLSNDKTVANNMRMPPVSGSIRGPRWNNWLRSFRGRENARPLSG